MVQLAFLGLCGSVAAAIFALFTSSQSAVILAVGLLLASAEIYAIFRLARGFTAAVIPVVAVNLVLLSSLFLWNDIRSESIVSVQLQATQDYLAQAAIIGVVFSAAYALGVIVAGPRRINVSVAQVKDSLSQLEANVRIPTGALVAIGYTGILLTAFARQDALLEGRYLAATGPAWAVTLSNALTPLSMLVLCIASARPSRWRILAIVGVGFWFLILFGRASRMIAALPAMLLVARAFVSHSKIGARWIIAAASATLLLLQLPLVGRINRDGVGIIPLAEQLFLRPEEVIDSFNFSGILGNILFSGPLTAIVANRTIPSEAFWVSINPMPGVLAGYYDIRSSLQVDKSTPFNAIGELGAHGWIPLAAVAFIVGFAISLSTRIAAGLPGAFKVAAMLIVLGITAFFAVSILQYNLRSSIRLVWYTLFAVTALWFVSATLDHATRPLMVDFSKTPRNSHD